MFSFFFQGKFVAFYQFAKKFNSDNFNYDQLEKMDFVFMRWKVSSQANSFTPNHALFVVESTVLIYVPFIWALLQNSVGPTQEMAENF